MKEQLRHVRFMRDDKLVLTGQLLISMTKDVPEKDSLAPGVCLKWLNSFAQRVCLFLLFAPEY